MGNPSEALARNDGHQANLGFQRRNSPQIPCDPEDRGILQGSGVVEVELCQSRENIPAQPGRTGRRFPSACDNLQNAGEIRCRLARRSLFPPARC